MASWRGQRAPLVQSGRVGVPACPAPAAAHCVLGHAVAAESVPTGKKMRHAGLIIPVLRCRFY